MRAILLSAALLLLPAAAVVAQAPAAPATQVMHRQHHRNPHKAALRIGKQLGLSPDQEARLEPILVERLQKADAIRANTQLSEADRQQQLKAMHHATRAEMSSVLTPDQMRQMKALHHARHAATTPTTGV